MALVVKTAVNLCDKILQEDGLTLRNAVQGPVSDKTELIHEMLKLMYRYNLSVSEFLMVAISDVPAAKPIEYSRAFYSALFAGNFEEVSVKNPT